jgi:hypothetical protein
MTIPKIIFRYSPIYDELWGEKIKKKGYPSSRKILNYIKKVEKLWRKDEWKVLSELSKITKLEWKEKQIYCYVVGKCIPISDPLTLPVYEKYPDYFIDVLVHEIIHLIFTQNEEKTKKAWDYIWRKYQRETKKTKIHIPLYAIHSHIYLKFYNERKLKRDIKLISHLRDYKRSWKIVQKEGYKKIIKEFRKRIQKC